MYGRRIGWILLCPVILSLTWAQGEHKQRTSDRLVSSTCPNQRVRYPDGQCNSIFDPTAVRGLYQYVSTAEWVYCTTAVALCRSSCWCVLCVFSLLQQLRAHNMEEYDNQRTSVSTLDVPTDRRNNERAARNKYNTRKVKGTRAVGGGRLEFFQKYYTGPGEADGRCCALTWYL